MFNGDIAVDFRHGLDTCIYNVNGAFVKFITATSTDKAQNGNDVITNTGNVTVYGKMADFSYTNGRSSTTLTATDVSIGTKERPIEINIEYTAEFDSGGKLVSMKKDLHPESKDVEISAESVKFVYSNKFGIEVSFELKGKDASNSHPVSLVIKNFKLYADLRYSSSGERSGSETATADVELSADTLEIKSGISILSVSLLNIDGFRLTTKASADMDGEEVTIGFDLFSVSGTIKNLFAGAKEIILGNYEMTFSLTATELKMIFDNAGETVKGNMLLTLSTKYNGLDRYLTVEFTGLEKVVSAESNVTNITGIHFKNELPLKQILKNIRDIGDDHEMELTAEGLCVKDGSIEIRTIDFYYRNMNVLDELYAKFDGAQLIYNEDDAKYDVFGKTVNGYLLDNGVKSGFAMNDVRFRAGLADNHEYNALHLISGDVDFYDGGALPLHLVIGEGVNFKANGLKVITLVSNSTEMKGTVAIDTSDGTFTSDPVRYVNLNGYNFLVYQEIDGVGAGGIVSFDLQPTHDGKYGGTITPCANHVLPTLTPSPRESDNIEYSLSGGILKFRIILDEPGKAIVRCVCPGNEFNLSYDGMSGEPKTVSTGAIVKLGTFLPQGVELWTDGSGKIYNRTDSYSMPARDVCFKPVSMKTASGFDEKSVEGKSVIDAKDSDVVAIGTDLTPKKDIVEIIVSGATIDMTKSTYQTIVEQVVGGGNVYIKALVVETVSTEDDRTVYDISITDKDGKSVEYDGSTSFTVTLNVAVSGHVEDIAVSYLDEYGHSHSVGVGSWQRCDDGTYDVTFEANHFSNYVVEPKISGSSDGSKIDVMVVVTAAIVIAIGLLVAYISFSSGKSEKTEDKSEDKSEDDSADSPKKVPKKVPKKKMRSV